MNATSLNINKKEPILKIVKSSLKNKSVNDKISINTLTPNFSFKNNKDETITTFKSML
ncbi:hypothetical protein MHL31_13465 [Lutibacter sp. A80]|uniref:hypothetical protein n=1 Tax=Lutibacter sp. A80 TaxID=2918453 RepID=UPI001F06AC9E|nr:hypothetical protein [Lutibacter sp. A80]UMB60080.1 hypothetical protein MHL31_13465 [Lutibacter sp. A80]